MLDRNLLNSIEAYLKREKQKVIVLFGPRQVGKTTLVKTLLSKTNYDYLKINAEEYRYQQLFSRRDLNAMLSLIENKKLLFIDEAQNIIDIGINLKILHDARPDLRIIVTGSSSFELANRMQEPLTGRIVVFHLYPLCISELNKQISRFEIGQRREEYMLYGLYPEVYNTATVSEKKELLHHLTSSYLYKDILQLLQIRHSQKLADLLRLLALQLGSTVSINKISNALNISSETVENYIDLLEKSFVLFRLPAYSRNRAKEISKSNKIYFYDLGIRNTILNNFTPLNARTDKGGMWENFLIAERMKKLAYTNDHQERFFWRTYNGAEIDYIEEKDGQLNAFEIKFSHKMGRLPISWKEQYSENFETINFDNWVDWLMF